MEQSEFVGLTNLKSLTIELCDWDFDIANATLNLIKELRRNSPGIRTLIFRIRMQPRARLHLNPLPLAIVWSADPERVRLLTRVSAEIGTLKNTEIVTKNLGWWTKMWYKWAPLVVVREAGDELRIEFDVNTEQ